VVGEIGLNESKSRRNMEANLKEGRLSQECAMQAPNEGKLSRHEPRVTAILCRRSKRRSKGRIIGRSQYHGSTGGQSRAVKQKSREDGVLPNIAARNRPRSQRPQGGKIVDGNLIPRVQENPATTEDENNRVSNPADHPGFN
jgi:hypothetical protein